MRKIFFPESLRSRENYSNFAAQIKSKTKNCKNSEQHQNVVMPYSFPHIERKVYPKTFLKDVHVIFGFDAVNNTAGLDAKVGDFFKEVFSLKDITFHALEKGFRVFSNDGLIVFVFGTSSVELAVKQPEYGSYERIFPLRSLMIRFLQLFDVNELGKLVMYKYNELKYQAAGDDHGREVMRNVFSDELLSDVGRDGQGDYTRMEKTVQIAEGEPGQSLFTVEYGFRRDADNQDMGFLTLKTRIESTGDAIPLADAESKMASFNQVLDDGFHWCVKPEIINIMNQA